MKHSLEVGTLAPLLEISTMKGGVYYIERSHEEAMIEAMNTRKFIRIGEETIAVHQILGMKPVMESTYMAHLTLDQRRTLALRIKQFEENLGRRPNEIEIQKFIEKITAIPKEITSSCKQSKKSLVLE